MAEKKKPLYEEMSWWPADLDFTPDEALTHIENITGEKPDMTGEPWWKRVWFKILRIT